MFGNKVKKAADSAIKRKGVNKLNNEKVDPLLFDSEIRDCIKLRIHYNRQARNATNENERVQLWTLYLGPKKSIPW